MPVPLHEYGQHHICPVHCTKLQRKKNLLLPDLFSQLSEQIFDGCPDILFTHYCQILHR